MKNYRLIILGMLISMAPLYSNAQDSGEILIPLSNAGQKGKLIVDIKRGSITVNGSNRSDISLKYEPLSGKSDNHSKSDEMPSGLKRISSGTMDLEVTENNNTVEVESDSWNKGLNLTIEIPKNFNLELSAYNNGDIYVKNIEGELVIENYNGKISATEI